MTQVQIITPAGMFGATAEDNVLDTALRVIGVAFGSGEEWASKYGTNYENDVFMMHRFCWCEQESCPWCAGCECPEESYRFFVDGKEVTGKEWRDFYNRAAGEPEAWEGPAYDAYRVRADAANSRRTTRHDPVCDFCTGEPFAKQGAVKGKSAPNFWFKPTGFRLWWYKYIGRGVEIEGDLPADFMQQIIASHPSGMTPDQAFDKYGRVEEQVAASFRKMFADISSVKFSDD